MTPTELQKLTPKEKSVKIAEACGIEPERRWRFFYDQERQHGVIDIRSREEAKECQIKNVQWWRDQGMEVPESDVEEYDEWSRVAPDYPTSLDAMHEAEKSPTAAQRADAFLLTTQP